MPRHKTRTSFVKNDPRVTKPKSEEFKRYLSHMYKNRVIVKCNYCLKDIEVIPSKVKNQKHFFCNKLCYNNWQKKTNWFNNRKFELTENGRNKLKKIWKDNGNKTWINKTNKQKIEWSIKMRKCIKNKMTSPELKILEIINKYNLNYRYSGDGHYWIGKINPDFINFKNKIILEVFGNYWHGSLKSRLKDFIKYIKLRIFGWNRIVLWESFIKNNTDDKLFKYIISAEKKIINNIFNRCILLKNTQEVCHSV